MVFALHYDRGDYGPGDFLEVDTQQNIPGHGLVWAPAAIIADSNSIVDLQKFIYAGLPPVNNIVKVKNFELQVYRIGKVVFAYWIVPITSAAVTLPPGCLLFKGNGGIKDWHPQYLLPNVAFGFDKVGFDAHATLFCPTWRYFGPVGDQDTSIGVDVNWWVTFTPPPT